jgi:putative addiction module killer protein
VDQDGRSLFREWLRRLDVPIRARIQARILRFETGNLGDHKLLGDFVWEALLAFGPGYRLYFGKSGQELVLLLLGGDKRSQTKETSNSEDVLDEPPERKQTWQDEVRIGTKDWPRTFKIQRSHANS